MSICELAKTSHKTVNISVIWYNNWIKRKRAFFVQSTIGKLATIATVILAATTVTAASSGLTTNPGSNQTANIIEIALDRGLILEIIVRCRRKRDGQTSIGIITYSRTEHLYCSSNNNCYPNPKKAVAETCKW